MPNLAFWSVPTKLILLKYLLSLLFLFLLNGTCNAQNTPYTLSEASEISIVTIGPGKYLYDKFGHSAFRVRDPQNNIDWAYNYGTYDFDTPNFYTKFAQGKLLYKLSVWKYVPFFELYKRENRWVKEQVLNLSPSEKNALFHFLQNNAKPENASYKYDFFYDNCATRIRDVLKEVLGEPLVYENNFVDESYSYRQLIQKNVHWNTWGSLGMDIAIGAVVDQTAPAWDYQFLPNYVFEAAENATLVTGSNKEPLVKETKTLFQNNPNQKNSSFFTSPIFVFGIIALLILFFTVKDFRNKTRSRYLDALLFVTTGLIGIVLLLLWFATDHSSTVANYNLLWAFPISIFLSVAIAKKTPKKWLRNYLVFLLIMMALLTLHSITGVQEFAPALIPLFVALVVRYLYVMQYIKTTAL